MSGQILDLFAPVFPLVFFSCCCPWLVLCCDFGCLGFSAAAVLMLLVCLWFWRLCPCFSVDGLRFWLGWCLVLVLGCCCPVLVAACAFVLGSFRPCLRFILLVQCCCCLVLCSFFSCLLLCFGFSPVFGVVLFGFMLVTVIGS